MLFALGIELVSDMYITNKNQMVVWPPLITKAPPHWVVT